MSKIILTKQAVLSAAPSTGKGALQLDANGALTVVQDSGVQDMAAVIKTGTWTPDLRFVAANTGITYSSRVGTYTKIGDVCFFQGALVLSSKGSATGTAYVYGLPFVARNTGGQYPPVPIQWLGMATNYVLVLGVIYVGQSYFAVNGITAASLGVAGISDAGFANTSELRFSGFYFV